MTTEATADDKRWADALSLAERTPTESAERTMSRWRRFRLLLVVAVVLLSLGGGLVAAVLGPDLPGTTTSDDVPTWQVIGGFSLASAGLVVQVLFLVLIVRRNRGWGWNSPVAVLSRAQRKGLLAQVRGSGDVRADRLPLARVLAVSLVAQPLLLISSSGLAVSLVGLWIATPSPWRAVLAVGYLVVLGAAWPFVARDARRARRFLDEHPDPSA